jgi:phospholipid/cholesterol/gamma-HCH transport system ATP-binding protein
MATTPKIELKGVHKRFGAKVVLDGIDLSVDPGESLVIIGGSGTGKSVMLKSILGLIKPDKGSIRVDGQEATRLTGGAREKLNRKFGMLFQGAALFDSLKVWENVAFALIQGRGMGRAKAKEIALTKLAKVGLDLAAGKSVPATLDGAAAFGERRQPLRASLTLKRSSRVLIAAAALAAAACASARSRAS